MQTTVVNLYKEPYDVYIGRSSKWGNPFPIDVGTSRIEAILRFRDYAKGRLQREPDWLDPLKGKRLGCYCKPKPCHGDVIVELLNGN